MIALFFGKQGQTMKSPHTGIRRILEALIHSCHGFAATFKSEAAFRQDLAIFCIGTAVALLLPINALGKGLLISSLIFILLMEAANTAIEVIVDRISEDYHELSKKAKDIGSLMVALSLVNAGVIWCVVLVGNFL